MKVKQDTIQESAERTTHDLQPVSLMLMPLAKKVLGKKGFVETDILTDWKHIVGEELASFVWPQSIDFRKGERNNGVLKVCVPSGAFALELQLREKSIIQKINTYFGYATVSSLRIIQNSTSMNEQKSERVESEQKKVVSAQEEIYIKELSSGIKNSALQTMLERLGICVICDNKEKDKNEI